MKRDLAKLLRRVARRLDPPPLSPPMIVNIYGSGLPVSGIMSELAFTVKTGALPIAPKRRRWWHRFR